MTIIIQYNMVCISCGQMLSGHWEPTGLDTVRLAAESGWHTSGGQKHICPDCEPDEKDSYPMSELRLKALEGPPRGYKPPLLVCPSGTKTNRRKGRCRGCGKELEPVGEAVQRTPEKRGIQIARE
jgi:hypothetical protein